MARTRAQNKENQSGKAPATQPTAEGSRPKAQGQKRQRKKLDEGKSEQDASKTGKPSTSKKVKTTDTKAAAQDAKKQESLGVDKSKLDAILGAYGALPLEDSGLVNVNEAEPKTILALVYLAMLTSARISHVLAYESVKCLLEAGYHDLDKLKQSTWQEKTEVLTKGGYTRYREKTATALEELGEFVDKEYSM